MATPADRRRDPKQFLGQGVREIGRTTRVTVLHDQVYEDGLSRSISMDPLGEFLGRYRQPQLVDDALKLWASDG